MGVPGLWAEFASVATHTTWDEVAWRAYRTHGRPLRLGIDAALWLFHVKKAQGGARPELRALFYRLARLLEKPIEPLFVFDGPQRPHFKRNARVHGVTRPIERQLCGMLDAFSFAHCTAPGEAEAELAWLNERGAVDAVLTDDVDFFVFGGRTAYRQTSEDALAVYDVGRLGVDRNALALIALLAGGDYDTRGMPKCGIKTAFSLAAAGYGARLVDAFKSGGSALVAWRSDVCAELTDNPSGRLARRMPRLAADMVHAFPQDTLRGVISYYIDPIISGVMPIISTRPLQVGDLAQCVSTLFQWPPDTAARRMERIYPGIFLRQILAHGDDAAPIPPREQHTPKNALAHRSDKSPSSPQISLITDYFAAVSMHSPPRKSSVTRVDSIHHGTDGRIEMVRIVIDCAAYAREVEYALGVGSAQKQQHVWLHESIVKSHSQLRSCLLEYQARTSPRKRDQKRASGGQRSLEDYFRPAPVKSAESLFLPKKSGDDSVEFIGVHRGGT